MKKASVMQDGKKVATVRVFVDGYELTGENGYTFYDMPTGNLSRGTVRKYAMQFSTMYLTGKWEHDGVTIGRLVESTPC